MVESTEMASFEASGYQDKRAGFWKSCFEDAQDYSTYLDQSLEKRARRWREMADRLPALTRAQRERLGGYGRKLNVLMVSGVWCGDCVRQGPMIRQIVESAGNEVRLRVIDRDVNETLREEVRILGALRVPVVVFLSEDFFEIGRFGDRMLVTYRRKAVEEVGAACAVPHVPPPAEELLAEQEEWVCLVERMLLMARLSPALRQRHGD